MGRPATLAIRITADASRAQRGMRSAQSSVGAFERGMRALGRVAKVGAAVGLGAATVAATRLGRAAVTAAIDAGRSQAALEGLYKASGKGAGEAAKATRLLNQTFSSSVIEMGAFRKGAENLAYLGLNARQSTDVLKVMERAIVATGGSSEDIGRVTDALLTMGNQGKATMNEINQISGAGIPVLDMLAAKWGTTVPKAMERVSKGGVKVEEVISAIQAKGGTYYKGLEASASKVEKSFWGVAQSAKNSIVNTLARELQPVIDRAAPALESLAEVATGKLIPGLASVASGLLTGAGAVVRFGRAAWDTAAGAARIAVTVAQILAPLGAFVAVLAGPYIAAVIAANVQGLIWVARLGLQATAMGVVRGVTTAWTVAQWALNAALTANPIALVIAALAALAVAIVIAYKRSATFRGIVNAVWSAAKKAGGYIGGAFVGAFRLAQAAVSAVVAIVRAVISWLGRIRVPRALGPIRTAFGRARDGAGWLIDKTRSVINWLGRIRVPSPLRALRTAFNAVRDSVGFVIDKVQSLIGLLKKLPGGGVLSKVIGAVTRSAPAPDTASRALGLAEFTPPGRLRPGASVLRPNLAVTVTIDGQQLQGRITRTVNGALRADGARLAAGGWA